MNHFDAAPHDPITLELWPQGSTSFDLYEDDGITREAIEGDAYAKTSIHVDAPPQYLSGKGKGARGNVTVTVGAAQGTFTGQLAERGWWLHVRARHAPVAVYVNDTILEKADSVTELEYVCLNGLLELG
jgi:hypothetical protein